MKLVLLRHQRVLRFIGLELVHNAEKQLVYRLVPVLQLQALLHGIQPAIVCYPGLHLLHLLRPLQKRKKGAPLLRHSAFLSLSLSVCSRALVKVTRSLRSGLIDPPPSFPRGRKNFFRAENGTRGDHHDHEMVAEMTEGGGAGRWRRTLAAPSNRVAAPRSRKRSFCCTV